MSQRRLSHVEWLEQKEKSAQNQKKQQDLENILKSKQEGDSKSNSFKRRESHADWSMRKTQESELNKLKTEDDKIPSEQIMFQKQLKDLRNRHAINEFNQKKDKRDENLEEIKLQEVRVEMKTRRESLSEKKNRVMMKLMAKRAFLKMKDINE